jgi:protocatechuate 3,4-dioxygenase beta subunit
MTESLGDERLHAIWLATVAKLKEVVREFHITQDELHQAGDYFDRLGQSGMSRSLIDVALAMTSVDVTSPGGGGTRSNLEGPYHAEHPPRPDGRLVVRDLAPDTPTLLLEGVVTDASTGAPLAGVDLDFWQADQDGIYDRKGHHLRGVVRSGSDGSYRIETVVPNDYSEHDHDPIGELFRAMDKPNTRAAHIHVKASLNGRELLTTQIFMPTSLFLDRDYVEGAVTPDLILDLVPADGQNSYTGRFDLQLMTSSEALT